MRNATIIILLAALTATAVVLPRLGRSTALHAEPEPTTAPTPAPNRVDERIVQAGDTFGELAETAQVSPATAEDVIAAAAAVHPLTEIRAGKPLRFVFAADGGSLHRVEYEINAEEELVVTTTAEGWQAIRQPILYAVKLATAEGTITSSLYETILEQGHDQRLAIALAEIFAWQIDFAVDVQAGDTYQILYEQRFRDGQYVRPGNILKAIFTNAGTTYSGYAFRQGTTDGYFDEHGRSLQRVFLKSPLTYRYVSSGYTGKRWDPIAKKITAHYAIDYAARTGTPTVSVGDGTVMQAGWNGGYGLAVTVRHNETFTTRYGHFSRIAKGIRPGTAVKQNQVIGYVGSTGHSTGPHLHYEMYRHGAKVNPFTVDLPAGDPMPETQRESFLNAVQRLDRLMTSANPLSRSPGGKGTMGASAGPP